MSRFCLWCNEEIVVNFSWSTIISMPKPQQFCERCVQALENLTGTTCNHCGRTSDTDICSDCSWWQTYFNNNDPLQYNHSVYQYNEFMKSLITKWKYRGDYVLIEAFKEEFIKHFMTTFSFLTDTVVVPIPLSEQRLQERGFNQAEQLAGFLPVPSETVLSRNNSEKQSKKSRYERIGLINPFKIHKRVNKKVILVDDIYTTGATIRHAATLLKQTGCPQVYSFTLIRG